MPTVRFSPVARACVPYRSVFAGFAALEDGDDDEMDSDDEESDENGDEVDLGDSETDMPKKKRSRK